MVQKDRVLGRNPNTPLSILRPVEAGLLSLVATLCGAVTAVLGVLSLSTRAAEEALRHRLAEQAAVLATTVDADAHRLLTRPADTDSELYRRVLDPLRRGHAAANDLAFVYTLVADQGTARFVLDTAAPGDHDSDGVEDRSSVWDAYADINPEALLALREERPVVTAEVYRDSWGSFLSAYHPLIDSKGQLAGILGVDFEASDFQALLREQSHVAFRGLLIAALIAVLVGAMVTFICRRQDATVRDLINARRDAEAGARAKAEFLANVSHELRTPLTSILGYAEVLRFSGDMSKAPEERLRCLNSIQTSGHHLLTVINDVLDLSKIESGAMSIERLEVDLPRVVQEIEEMFSGRAAETGISLRFEVQGSIPRSVQTDPTRLRQILCNLVANSIRFTRQGGVTLRVSRPSGEARIVFEIEDTGVGIPPDRIDRLFQPFSQADSSVARTHGGTGLGLAISRRLARMLDGDVTLDWSQPGVGTCFRVSLPTLACSAERVESFCSQADVEAPAAPLPKLAARILLVEDNPVNRRLFRVLLERLSMEVIEAEDGGQALERLASMGHCNLILTDLQMPRVDGYSLARKLRQDGYQGPLIALTANALDDERERCLASGIDDFLTKPIRSAELAAALGRWLNKGAKQPSA
jgi:signal transduction histidine kinase/ActR/RegA family two-component response regulator